MSVVANWNKLEYQRIASVDWNENVLIVRFEDGSTVEVDAQRVLPPGTDHVDWDTLTFNEYEIVVHGSNGPVEIPWSTIRVLTDVEYAAHLASATEEQVRQIGLRIRELRESRNISSTELAKRAGITPQSLSRIEYGYDEVVFTTLRRILTAMGCSLKDLALPE